MPISSNTILGSHDLMMNVMYTLRPCDVQRLSVVSKAVRSATLFASKRFGVVKTTSQCAHAINAYERTVDFGVLVASLQNTKDVNWLHNVFHVTVVARTWYEVLEHSRVIERLLDKAHTRNNVACFTLKSIEMPVSTEVCKRIASVQRACARAGKPVMCRINHDVVVASGEEGATPAGHVPAHVFLTAAVTGAPTGVVGMSKCNKLQRAVFLMNMLNARDIGADHTFPINRIVWQIVCLISKSKLQSMAYGMQTGFVYAGVIDTLNTTLSTVMLTRDSFETTVFNTEVSRLAAIKKLKTMLHTACTVRDDVSTYDADIERAREQIKTIREQVYNSRGWVPARRGVKYTEEDARVERRNMQALVARATGRLRSGIGKLYKKKQKAEIPPVCPCHVASAWAFVTTAYLTPNTVTPTLRSFADHATWLISHTRTRAILYDITRSMVQVARARLRTSPYIAYMLLKACTVAITNTRYRFIQSCVCGTTTSLATMGNTAEPAHRARVANMLTGEILDTIAHIPAATGRFTATMRTELCSGLVFMLAHATGTGWLLVSTGNAPSLITRPGAIESFSASNREMFVACMAKHYGAAEYVALRVLEP